MLVLRRIHIRAVPFKSIGVGRNAGQLFLLCRGGVKSVLKLM